MSGQLVTAETGVLRVFNDAGVFAAADVHVARRVAALSGAAIGDDELVATALAVRAVRTGSTCVRLNEITAITAERPDDPADDGPAEPEPLPWPEPAALVDTLRRSPLVTGCPSGPLRPLALVDSESGPLLYLRKYFRQEQSIRAILDRRRSRRPVVDADRLGRAVDAVFAEAGEHYDRQRAAAALAATSWTTVLAGGPGTGKTYTVARILAVMEQLLGENARIGLCAPTGRAAAQMQASINDYRTGGHRLHHAPVATTVHKMLGSRPDGSFWRGADNRLPYEVVVVDETSMLSVTLMSRLLEALRPDTRLILVGDPHQLSSVDAGVVLADLVDRAGRVETGLPEEFLAVAPPPEGEFTEAERLALADGVITLTRGHRYGGQISAVAAAIQAADGPDGAAEVVDLITGEGAQRFAADTLGRVVLVDPERTDPVRAQVISWARALHDAAGAGRDRDALAALMRHRVLCAHRDGRYGVSGWSRRIVDWINEDLGGAIPPTGNYVGEPLLVNKNDVAHRIFNGDSGVVIADGDGRTVVFERGDEVMRLHPSQVADASPVYAMTIHRSQGSQFGAVTVVLPGVDAQLLTKELLYTAVTRARETVYIVGTEAELIAAVNRPVQRASGLGLTVREL
ncbi:exodeoxyribonuclease V subunit alpha [Gordonia iterans]|uniref:RecBCD enzyme subunit RecD n=1 Tax=Gordonia iterans TaxID=1004901 RepID=A0A2S0KGM5_9ACTN|nr:exodeoxyribonuclease V subunit alpha [Gordonia iterans]